MKSFVTAPGDTDPYATAPPILSDFYRSSFLLITLFKLTMYGSVRFIHSFIPVISIAPLQAFAFAVLLIKEYTFFFNYLPNIVMTHWCGIMSHSAKFIYYVSSLNIGP